MNSILISYVKFLREFSRTGRLSNMKGSEESGKGEEMIQWEKNTLHWAALALTSCLYNFDLDGI